MNGLEIRESITEDTEEMNLINKLSWDESYSGILSAVDWKERRKWQEEIYSAKKSKSLVAIMDDKIVGYCNLGPMRTAEDMESWVSHSSFKGDEEEWGEIYAIYVQKSYSRLGIGKALFEKAKEAIGALGYEQFQVYTLEQNLPAIHFYRRMNGLVEVTRDWSHSGKTYKEIGMVFYINNTN